MRCHSSSAERCSLGCEGRVLKRYIAPSVQRMPSDTLTCGILHTAP